MLTYFLRGDRYPKEMCLGQDRFPSVVTDFLANLTSRDRYPKEICLGRDRFPRDGFPTTPGYFESRFDNTLHQRWLQ